MLVAFAHIARIDAVLGEAFSASGKVTQQSVPVVVKIPDQGHINAHAVQLLSDVRHGLCGLWGVDSDAYELGARDGQLLDLNGRPNGVGRVRVGHGLNANRGIGTHGDHIGAPRNASRFGSSLGGLRHGNGQGIVHHVLSIKMDLNQSPPQTED